MYAARQVMAVIDDVVSATLLQNTVVARTVDGLVGISLQYAALILKGTHRTSLRCGILNAVSVIVTRPRRIGKIVCVATLKHKGSLENIF